MIITSWETCPAHIVIHVPQCINRGNGHIIIDHLHAKITTIRAEIKILVFSSWYSSTCDERTPLGPGKSGRSSEGRGGCGNCGCAKHITPCTTALCSTTRDIHSEYMHWCIMHGIIMVPKINELTMYSTVNTPTFIHSTITSWRNL